MRPGRSRALAALSILLVIVLAACGGSGGGQATPAQPGASATPTPTPMGGGGGGSTEAPAETVNTDPTEDTGSGPRALDDAYGFDGSMRWSGTMSYGSWQETMSVKTDLVLRRDKIKQLAFAVGSKVTVHWQTSRPEMDCPSEGTYTGPLSSISGEGVSNVSDQKPFAIGQVLTAIHDVNGETQYPLVLSIYIPVFPLSAEGFCDSTDFDANCPYKSPALDADQAWAFTERDPLKLTWSCANKDLSDPNYGWDVKGDGTLLEVTGG